MNEQAELISLAEQKLTSLLGMLRLAPPHRITFLYKANDLLDEALLALEEKVPVPLHHTEDVEHDEFLIKEGLDLLAAYRAVQAPEVRKSIMMMIASIAHNDRDRSFTHQASTEPR